MRTTVVPAQITSVEDRIAGNLTFAQVLLLIVPLLLGTAIYVGIAPRSDLTVAKSIFVAIQFLFFGGLAIRFNGKILAQWLVIYFRFFIRPTFYVFTKNDLAARNVILPVAQKEELTERTAHKLKPARQSLSFSEQIRMNELLDNPSLTVSFELAKKGGIDVSLVPIKD